MQILCFQEIVLSGDFFTKYVQSIFRKAVFSRKKAKNRTIPRIFVLFSTILNHTILGIVVSEKRGLPVPSNFNLK